MRTAALLLVVLACAGCSRFEHPILGEGGPALDAALVGDWEAARDDEHVRIHIERDGDAGLAVLTKVENGRSEEDRAHLITSRVGQLTFMSVQSASQSKPDDEPGSWYHFRYELPTPDRLVVYSDDGTRWRAAVHDGLVAGEVSDDPRVQTFDVTASGPELRKFLEGYGAVIFRDEPAAEFQRVSAP